MRTPRTPIGCGRRGRHGGASGGITLLNILTTILDEWLLNKLPMTCGSTWRRYVAMGLLTAAYRGSPAELALVFRSPEVWEEAILELLTTQRAPAPLGYPDRIQPPAGSGTTSSERS